jgi:hypothetical protein
MVLPPRPERLQCRGLRPWGVLLLFGLTFALPAAGEDYAAIFGRKYAEAEQFLDQNTWIAESLNLSAVETCIAEAVVFPEVVRFRILEDEIQVRALKVLYVQLGRTYANFSIGHFQMKPSFAEQLERDYDRLFSAAEKTAAGITAYDLGDSSHRRHERVRRLDNLYGQAEYLRLFMLIMDRLYAKVAFADDLEKLRFYATAYNAGYSQGEAAIRQAMGVRRFHVQLLFPKTRYKYADVAVYYFNHHPAQTGDGTPEKYPRP